jgi:hypothetical protein
VCCKKIYSYVIDFVWYETHPMSKWNFRWIVKVGICDWIAYKVALNKIREKHSQDLNWEFLSSTACGRILEPLDSELIHYQLLYLGKARFHQVPFKERNVQGKTIMRAWEEREFTSGNSRGDRWHNQTRVRITANVKFIWQELWELIEPLKKEKIRSNLACSLPEPLII